MIGVGWVWFLYHLQQCAASSFPDEQLVLLHIEEQAMVQVIIKEVANHLDLKDNSKINTVSQTHSMLPNYGIEP